MAGPTSACSPPTWLVALAVANCILMLRAIGVLVRWRCRSCCARVQQEPQLPAIKTNVYVITAQVPAMAAAFQRLKDMGVTDPEYDKISDPVPKFANHSNRRHADRVAVRNMKELGVTETDINFFFGWELKKMDEKMLLHYRGMDRLLRLGLSKVTQNM